jgi:hypothetical protein
MEQMLLVLDLSLCDKLGPSFIKLLLVLGMDWGKSKPVDRDVLPNDVLKVLSQTHVSERPSPSQSKLRVNTWIGAGLPPKLAIRPHSCEGP